MPEHFTVELRWSWPTESRRAKRCVASRQIY